MAEEEAAAEEQTKKKKKYRRDKPWDDETIDHWKIDPFTAEDNPFGGMSAFLNSWPDVETWSSAQLCQSYIVRCLLLNLQPTCSVVLLVASCCMSILLVSLNVVAS